PLRALGGLAAQLHGGAVLAEALLAPLPCRALVVGGAVGAPPVAEAAQGGDHVALLAHVALTRRAAVVAELLRGADLAGRAVGPRGALRRPARVRVHRRLLAAAEQQQVEDRSGHGTGVTDPDGQVTSTAAQRCPARVSSLVCSN